MIVVGIKKSPGGMNFNPDASVTIAAGDTLIVMGEEDDLKKIEATCLARTWEPDRLLEVRSTRRGADRRARRRS